MMSSDLCLGVTGGDVELAEGATNVDWVKRLSADLEGLRHRQLSEDREWVRAMGYDSLARIVGFAIGGLGRQDHTMFAHYLFAQCKTDQERVVLACVLATWSRQCALQWLWLDTGRYSSFRHPGLGVDEAWEYSRFGYRARLHVHQRVEGNHTLSIAVDFSTFLDLDDGPHETWRREEVTARCNIEVGGSVDWKRDVAVQSAGYMVCRVFDAELSADPVTVAESIFEVLKREVDRLLSEIEEAQKGKGLRLVSP
jgi:hypothetical protein